ncbi:MAG: hypothetical protein ACTHNU_18455 [Gaiellales bacterium]
MDLAIAIGQGLGLAAAAGLLASAPLAFTTTAASQGWLEDPLSFAGRTVLIVVTWVAVALELAADFLWPGAQAGFRLGRRVVAGGLAFELAAGGKVPYVGLAVGAATAAVAALAMRPIRAGAVKAGGDLRGTALVEDGGGLICSAAAIVPFVGYLISLGAAGLLLRVRRREGRKYEGLRVLR